MNESDQHLKDLFAGMAMLGMLSAGKDPAYTTDLVTSAYEVADAMMDKRQERIEEAKE